MAEVLIIEDDDRIRPLLVRGLRECGHTVTSAPTAVPSPQGPAVGDEVSGEWGTFVVECRDTYAYGVAARPDRAAGWRVVSWEKGPDDDVDAVFSDGRNSVDLEVFCNRGRPALAEIERNTLGDDD